jgi:integrase
MALRARILPQLGDMTFEQLNGVELKRFIQAMGHKSGKKIGRQLSGSTIRNTMTVLRVLWYDAVEENGWDLKDPFEYLKRPSNKHVIPSKVHEAPVVFRYHEWIELLNHMDPYYRPMVELMVMTGMIASEVAALKVDDISEGVIKITRSLTLGIEKDTLKTDFRRRDIPITSAIRQKLSELIPRARKGYLFTMSSGERFDGDNFRKNPWTRALRKAGISYRVPYTSRHTFAAWALVAGMNPEKLVDLMGHSTKKMVYETYGKYVGGLETDGGMIKAYFGSDFM